MEMFFKNNMSVKARKKHFGFPESEFFGATLDTNGYRMTNHNLDPICKCVAPKDVHEVQRVLGLFVQHLG